MKQLYLIGGSGFIGKNLVHHLNSRYRITVIDKYIDEPFFRTYPSVSTVQLDLERELIDPAVETPDYIINLASVVTADRDLGLFEAMLSSNLQIFLNLYRRFSGDDQLKLLIQFGSSEEYGSEGSPFKEEQRESPGSPYALAKQITTNTALMLNRNDGFPVSVVRPGNLFGPYQNRQKFIPYVIDCLKNNHPLKVTPCDQKRDFIHAGDFAECIGSLLEHSAQSVGQIVNVSSGESISLKEIIEYCRAELGSRSEVHYGAFPYRANEAMDLRCSIERLERMTGRAFRFDIRKRLKEYITTV